ncbi:MAG: hypothetical protein FJW39_32110 [Acidobacteria bacterium]|nr:hypothetical protein [Acidobacteriota bacterium]
MRWLGFAAIAVCLLAQAPEVAAVKSKIQQIEQDRIPAGGKVFFTSRELNLYVTDLLKAEAGDGLKNPKLVLGTNRAEGSAVVNFVKLQTAKGQPPGLLIGLLLRGEHDLTVRVRGRSSGGQAQVDVDEVTLDGLVIRGKTLELLIEYYLQPRVPDVKIGKPFELRHGVDRFEAAPEGLTIYGGTQRAAR